MSGGGLCVLGGLDGVGSTAREGTGRSQEVPSSSLDPEHAEKELGVSRVPGIVRGVGPCDRLLEC